MFPNLPDLRILPLPALIPHEEHDSQRTKPLVTRLGADCVLCNPPIAAPLRERYDHYVVLDSINRVTALQAMQLPHILMQVAETTFLFDD